MIELILLSIIFLLGFVLILSNDYMKSIIVISTISILASITYLVMYAPDVALTEAAVGACASSCILIIGIRSLQTPHSSFQPQRTMTKSIIILAGTLFILLLTLLSYYALELHQYGDNLAIAKDGASAYYIANIEKDIGIKSLVTAILASYRGIDTFCETLVIVTAGICVMFILKRDAR